MKSPVSGNN
jgi:Acyl-CoA synthetases (AMP-forming)/AMP-acid ligases II